MRSIDKVKNSAKSFMWISCFFFLVSLGALIQDFYNGDTLVTFWFFVVLTIASFSAFLVKQRERDLLIREIEEIYSSSARAICGSGKRSIQRFCLAVVLVADEKNPNSAFSCNNNMRFYSEHIVPLIKNLTKEQLKEQSPRKMAYMVLKSAVEWYYVTWLDDPYNQGLTRNYDAGRSFIDEINIFCKALWREILADPYEQKQNEKAVESEPDKFANPLVFTPRAGTIAKEELQEFVFAYNGILRGKTVSKNPHKKPLVAALLLTMIDDASIEVLTEKQREKSWNAIVAHMKTELTDEEYRGMWKQREMFLLVGNDTVGPLARWSPEIEFKKGDAYGDILLYFGDCAINANLVLEYSEQVPDVQKSDSERKADARSITNGYTTYVLPLINKQKELKKKYS